MSDKGVVLSGAQIKELAEAAGFKVELFAEDENELETEWWINTGRLKVMCDDGIKTFSATCSIVDYPEEGAYPLGDPITPQEDS